MHTTDGDEEQNDALFIKRVMNGKTYNTTGTIQNTMSIYPTLHAVVGMRFHAAILSCVHEIPFFLLSYGPKTEALIKILEVEEFILRPDLINMERISKMWYRLEERYDKRVALMKEKHVFIRAELIKKLRTL
jgi:polysaccharide pyruvyl transferase WcaK-like protein